MYSTFYKTTKAFKQNFPGINLLRTLWLRPYRGLKDRYREWKYSARELFEQEMNYHIQTNNFFGDRKPYRPFDEVYAGASDVVKESFSIPTPGAGKNPIADWQQAIEVYSTKGKAKKA
jgi:hypothetical protein